MKNSMLLISVLIMGCGETTDGLRQLNSGPFINFNDQENVRLLQDSIKMQKSHAGYSINLRVEDPNDNLRTVVYTQLSGQGILFEAGQAISSSSIDVTSGHLTVDYVPESLGFHQLRFTAIDNFEVRSSVVIELTAFDNLPPVAAFTFSRSGQFGRLHWSIDASESYDRDARYGGEITAYAFKNGLGRIDVIQVPDTLREGTYAPWVYHVIFPKKNVYTVGVRVRDNDGRWSGWVEQTVVVE